MIFFLLFNILFSQQSIIENTSAIEYKVNNIGIIGLDSTKGHFIFPKESQNNFIYSIGIAFAGKKATDNEIFTSYTFKNDKKFSSGIGQKDTNEKFNIYESKYFEKTTGESFLNEFNYPLYNYSSDKPGVYEDDNQKRNLANYQSVFIQSDNDLFSVFSDSINETKIEYHQRILNFNNVPYIIIETKIINRNDFDLIDCYYSAYLDPDITQKGREFLDNRNDNGVVVDDNIIFYSSNDNIPYYLGFKYLQKNLIEDGNYIFKKNKQLKNVNYNLISPSITLNSNNLYDELRKSNLSTTLTDVKALAGIGKFDLKKNDTLVVTYAIAIAGSVDGEADDELSNMQNIFDLLNSIEDIYYQSIFDFALSVNFSKFKDKSKVIFDLSNYEFIDIEKINSLKNGKYLILRKKEYKFELVKKIQVE